MENRTDKLTSRLVIRRNILCRVLITFGSDGDELDAFAGDEIQGFVDIGDLVESHFTAVGLWQRLA